MTQEIELRIGNLLMDAKGRICTVDSISKDDGFKASAIKGAITSFLVGPIELTEEWLLKAGFEKDGFNAFNKSINPFNKGNKLLCFSQDYLYLKEGIDNDCISDICTLWNKDLMGQFYVHSLQNLYHALTGEELKFAEH